MYPVFIRILEILLVPYIHREVLWTVAPLIFALVMIQMYFGKYKTEQLGWNTAYGNTISLMWVTAILLKYLSDTQGLIYAWNTMELRGYLIMIVALGLFTLILAILNFEHLIPKKLAFLISSSLPTNIGAYFIIVIVLGRVTLDWTTFWAAFLIFVFLWGVFKVYKDIITPAESALQTLKRHEEVKKKKVRSLKMKFKRRFDKIFHRKKKK